MPTKCYFRVFLENVYVDSVAAKARSIHSTIVTISVRYRSDHCTSPTLAFDTYVPSTHYYNQTEDDHLYP